MSASSRPPRVLLSVLALALGSCGEGGRPSDGTPPSAPRSMVVITLDTTRADALGAYGSPLAVTPRFDALAEQGAQFLNAYAPMPQTLPAHATLFTGLMPRHHGALENTYVLPEPVQTLAETAKARGYATGGFIGALAIEQATGISQGFDTWSQPAGEWGNDKKGHPPQRRAEEVTDAALAWADGLDPERPFLLWAHYYDPHGDHRDGFDPPAQALAAIDTRAVKEVVESRRARFTGPFAAGAMTTFWAGYFAELAYTDEQMGRLLDGLQDAGLMDDTLLVIVADHGEGLWEHGVKAHGTHLWEESMRVPLVIVDPRGVGAGRKVAGRVILQDIEPTLRRGGLGDAPQSRDEVLGVDLWTLLAEGREPPLRPVVLERPHYDEDRMAWRGNESLQYGFLTALLMGDLKLLREPDGSHQLYDLATDPDELVDVASARPADAARMLALLEAWMDRNQTGAPGSAEISDERAEILRQLGYMGDDGD